MISSVRVRSTSMMSASVTNPLAESMVPSLPPDLRWISMPACNCALINLAVVQQYLAQKLFGII